MAKTIWVVRVSVDSEVVSNAMLECLRYAGIAKPHAGEGFDLYPPQGTGDTKVWAEQNASRMLTYGFAALPVRAGTPLPK